MKNYRSVMPLGFNRIIRRVLPTLPYIVFMLLYSVHALLSCLVCTVILRDLTSLMNNWYVADTVNTVKVVPAYTRESCSRGNSLKGDFPSAIQSSCYQFDAQTTQLLHSSHSLTERYLTHLYYLVNVPLSTFYATICTSRVL